jgi:uncharacterized protein (DUF58 family)
VNELPAAADLAAFGRLARRLLVQADSRRAGTRTVRGRRGAGLEFLEHRDYRAGDELRHVDWRLSARRSALLVRERQVDAGGDWWLCVDASSSMATGAGAKWRVAVQCAVAFGYSLLDLGSRVGLLVYADDVVMQLPCGRGHTQFARLARALREWQPVQRRAGSRLASCAAQLSTQASAIAFSDFLTMGPWQRELAQLRAQTQTLRALAFCDAADRRLPLHQHLSLMDIETGQQRDLVPGAAQLEAAAHAWSTRVRELQRCCARESIRFSVGDVAAGWRGAAVQHLRVQAGPR